ncbi:MAG: hypothetical protein M1508_07145, partial [Nitrospirae bacterium]|nr:hypothetical protein [Nitrospirota bacterium]
MKRKGVKLLFHFFLLIMAGLIMPELAQGIADCPSGMTHYWKLDELSSPYVDFYGTNDATCTNCP